jgi:hypothetical protein
LAGKPKGKEPLARPGCKCKGVVIGSEWAGRISLKTGFKDNRAS